MDLSHETFEVFTLESKYVSQGEKRIDSNYYCNMSFKLMIEHLKERNIEIKKIGDLAEDIVFPGRFKRNYVSKEEGNPFLTPSDIFMFYPKTTKYIVDYPENVSIEKNWILVTRSGSIGKCLISTDFLKKFVISDDLIRINPLNEKWAYIYIYLRSSIGQSFLTKDQYGVTVKHIEPKHVSEIPIPIIPSLEYEIRERMVYVQKLREESQWLLLRAEEAIYSELDLQKINENEANFFDNTCGSIKASIVNFNELNGRLDASFHAPILKLLIDNLKNNSKKNGYKLIKLDDVAEIYHVPTYKRIYVDSENGLPILSGVHLKQMQLVDLKYISKESFQKTKKNNLEKYQVKSGWILTTERGTTGISSLVTDLTDGWLASHNILRIVPQNINSGYLLAFLDSEYGQIQLKSKELGAVIDVLDPKDMANIFILIPSNIIQEKIGSLVIEAYKKRDKANQIEKKTIDYLENELEKRIV